MDSREDLEILAGPVDPQSQVDALDRMAEGLVASEDACLERAIFGDGKLGTCTAEDGNFDLSPRREYVPGSNEICLVSHHTGSTDRFARISIQNHATYARAHGYHYFHYEGHFGEKTFVNPDTLWRPARYGLFWEKVIVVQKTLALMDDVSGRQTCSWVMWADSDTIITDMGIRIEDLIKDWKKHDPFSAEKQPHLVLARDESESNGYFINAGVFLVKNSRWGRALLKNAVDWFPELRRKHHKFHLGDQDAFHALVFGVHPESIPSVGWKDLHLPTHPLIGLPSQRLFNSYAPRKNAELARASLWAEGDFICHFAGLSFGERVVQMGGMARTSLSAACASP